MSNFLATVLRFFALRGRWILVTSLVVGLTSSTLANLVKPHIDVLIAFLLFTACLRVGPKQALGAVHEMKTSVIIVVVLQILLPLAVSVIALISGLSGPLVTALVLLAAAPSLSGSPHLVILLGYEPSPALRQLVVGTALLPLTIIPVFIMLPEFASLSEIVFASLRLVAIIAIAASLAFALRLTVMKNPAADTIVQIDGVSTILLAITVIGLMAAIGEEFSTKPQYVLATLGLTIIANFGLQIATALLLARSNQKSLTVPIAIVAGNRNIALFLTALPAATTEPLLLFIACYQIPMYLTPIVMRPFYKYLNNQIKVTHH